MVEEEDNRPLEERLVEARRIVAMEIILKEIDPVMTRQLLHEGRKLSHSMVTLDKCLGIVEQALMIHEPSLS